MSIAFIIIAISLSIFSGFCKAICDLSEEGKLKFRNKGYWIKKYSSNNKWKNGDKSQGEKFFGSSRWFVALTDAWHLFGTFMFYSYWISFGLSGFTIGYNFHNKWYLFLLLLPFLSRLSFHVFHTYKILKNEN